MDLYTWGIPTGHTYYMDGGGRNGVRGGGREFLDKAEARAGNLTTHDLPDAAPS